MGADSAVLKLECPFCNGTLNLRRIHLGIEGECVYCLKPVTAIEDESGCRLVSSMGIPDSPFPGKVDSIAPSMAMEASPQLTAHQNPEMVAEPEPIAESTPEIAAGPPAEPSQSPWGFPEKEKAEGPLDQIGPVSFTEAEPPAKPEPEPLEPEPLISERIETALPTQPAEEVPFQSPSQSPEWLQEKEASVPAIEEVAVLPPPLPGGEEAAPPTSQNTVPFQEIAQVVDASSHVLAETDSMQAADVPPPLEAIEESSFESPPPLEPSPEAPAFGNSPPAIPEDTVDTAEAEGSPPETTNHSLPEGISPFSTGSAKRFEPGFAETLFTDAAESEAAVTPPALSNPEAPGTSLSDDVALNAANHWGPPPVAKTSDGVELDFSAITPVTQEKASDSDSEVPEKLTKKRKSGSGIFKKIFKFFLTVAIIGGIAFAANTFVPAAKWSEWKQQAIDWLEPGSVILEKLPFGKNKSASMAVPAPKAKSVEPARQGIAEGVLQIPPRVPGG